MAYLIKKYSNGKIRFLREGDFDHLEKHVNEQGYSFKETGHFTDGAVTDLFYVYKNNDGDEVWIQTTRKQS